MTFRRIHTDQSAWFCVFRSDQTGEHVLYAALREKDFPEVAMRLTADETALFRDRPTDFWPWREILSRHTIRLFIVPGRLRFAVTEWT